MFGLLVCLLEVTLFLVAGGDKVLREKDVRELRGSETEGGRFSCACD